MTAAGRHEWPEGTFVGSLPEGERAALLAAGTPVRFEDDQIMLVQGDTGDFAYVLTGGMSSGGLQLTRGGAADKP